MSNAIINNASAQNLSNILYLNLDKAHFFNTIAKHFLDIIKCDQVRIFEILEDGSSILVSKNGISVDGQIKNGKGEGAQAYIARTKRAYFSNSVERDPVFINEAKEGVLAELAFPISSEGVVIGSIHCQNIENKSEFSREHMTLGMNILSEIKGPVQNMKMYLEAKHLNAVLLKTIEQKDRELKESRVGLKITDSHLITEKEIIGRTIVMRDLLNLTDKIADKEISAYIIGESGTGKEILAKRIHCKSTRRTRAFVIVDCSTLNELALDLELFGDENRMGALEMANHGSVYLKRVDLMPLNIQNKLMQFINYKMGIKTNGKDVFRSDIKLISSSTRDISELVSEKKFRDDLYFAISGVVLKIPALRERKEDIEILANFLLNSNRNREGHKSFSPSALKALSEYQWGGNVRELQNAVERAYVLSEGSVIEKLHLDNNLQIKEEKIAPIKEEVILVKTLEFIQITLEELERTHIMSTLENLSGNKTRAAKSLGITVKTLYNKLHSYGIHFEKEGMN
jgi:DNA-binding NtrC family response regulator